MITGPRLYRTGLPRPLLNALQTSLGVIMAKASGTLDLSVRKPISTWSKILRLLQKPETKWSALNNGNCGVGHRIE